jgi:hypothetical protein
MKLVDEKGRLFGLINIIDLVVLVVILALVGFGAYKTIGFDNNGTPTEIGTATHKATIVFEVREVRDFTINSVSIGEVLKDYSKNTDYGTITNVEVKPAIRLIETEDGKIVEAVVPGKSTMLLFVDGFANVSQTSILMAGRDVRIGYDFDIKGLKFKTRGTIIDIDLAE